MVLIIEHTWVAVEQCYDPTRQPGLDHHVSFKAVVKFILDGPAPSLWPFSTSGPDDRVPCIDAKQLHVTGQGALPRLAWSANKCGPTHNLRWYPS